MKAALVFVGLCAAGAVAENPLGKTMQLLGDLQAKIIAEGEAEAKAFKEYYEWCDDASTEKGFEIKTATSQKEALEAEIAKQAGVASAAVPKIEGLAASIGEDGAELKTATGLRDKEKADFAATEKELLDVIDTLGRAIAIVEKEMAKNPAAFAQLDTSSVDSLVKSLSVVVDAASFPSADQKKLLALVQAQQGNADDDDAMGEPSVAAYKTHSTGIVDVLEDLKDKAEEQLESLRKAEGSAAHNYAMLKQSLEDQMGADTKSMAAEKAVKAAAEEKKAAAEGDLAETLDLLKNGEGMLAEIKKGCLQTAADHEATVTARTEELSTLAKAKSLLAESTSGAVSQTYSMLQLESHSDLARYEIVTIVKKLAKKQRSTELAQLASRIAAIMKYGAKAGEDPFAKVKGLISGLITKLENDGASDASEKAYCDEQISKTEAKKAETEEDLDKLTTKIDQASAKSTKLKAEVKALQAELADLAKSQAEMDEIRAKSHSDYSDAKAMLEEGLTGVRGALSTLRDYYSSASSAASFAQEFQAQPAAPEKFEKATGAGSSIIGILEVVESDFAANLAKVETEETDEANEYEKVTQENAVAKTIKDQAVKYKALEYKSLDGAVATLANDRDTKDAEHSAILDYYGKIKERCIAKPEAYEERKERREAEIAGLKQALSVLENEAAFVQRRKKGHSQYFLGA